MTGRTAAAGGPGWLHTDGATIKTADGRPYVIKAVAWFGMETASCAPHGLWQIGLDDGLAQIASFGFTTIRLPFSNECLHASATTGIDARTNPDLVGLSPLRLMDRVVARAKAHGLTVILDRHRPESSAQSPLWYTAQVPDTSQWIAVADAVHATSTHRGLGRRRAGRRPAGGGSAGGHVGRCAHRSSPRPPLSTLCRERRPQLSKPLASVFSGASGSNSHWRKTGVRSTLVRA